MIVRAVGPAYTFRRCQAADQPALARLFDKTYSKRGPVALSAIRRYWQWKFGEHPLGCQSMLALSNTTGQVIGHIGGIPYRTCIAGTERLTVQTVDHMIDPACRRGLQRRGLFTRLMLAWLDAYCGPRQDLFGWGFPSREALRIGTRFCHYALVQSVVMLVNRQLHRNGSAGCGVDVSVHKSLSPEVDDLWRRCRAQHRMVHDRTWEYLDWRYTKHPGIAYTILEARDAGDGALRGLAVTRFGGLAPDTITIMDWIMPAGDEQVRKSLLAGIGKLARDHHIGAVLAWFPETTREHVLFQIEGFRSHPTEIVMAGQTFVPWLSLDEVRKSLYLTFGDIDYL